VWRRGSHLNRDASFVVIRECATTSGGGDALRQGLSGWANLGVSALWNWQFVDQTTDYCIALAGGEIELIESMIVNCVYFVKAPSPAGLVYVRYCVFDALPAAAPAAFSLGPGNVVAESSITPFAECADVEFAAECTIFATCSRPRIETLIPPPDAVGCEIRQYPPVQVVVVGLAHVCFVECTFAYITSSGHGGVAKMTTSGNMTFIHCAFLTCSSTGYGGALFAEAGTVVIENCCAQAVRTTDYAGFARFQTNAKFKISYLSLHWCEAAQTGGGMTWVAPGLGEFVNFTRCRCRAGGDQGGGAIFIATSLPEVQHHWVIDLCGALTTGSLWGAVLVGAQPTIDTNLRDMIFIRGDISHCVRSQKDTYLESCQSIACDAYFSVAVGAEIHVSSSVFDWGPVPTPEGISLDGDCSIDENLSPAAGDFLIDPLGASFGCSVGLFRPEETLSETLSESNTESGTASPTVTPLSTNTDTPISSVTATTRESDQASSVESDLASAEASPTASPAASTTISPVPTVDVNNLQSDGSAVSAGAGGNSNAIASGGSVPSAITSGGSVPSAITSGGSVPSAITSGGSNAVASDGSVLAASVISGVIASSDSPAGGIGKSAIWAIGTIVGTFFGLAVGAAVMAWICLCFSKGNDRVGEDEEGKAELKASAVSTSEPVFPQAAGPISEPDVVSDKLESGSDHDSSPAPDEKAQELSETEPKMMSEASNISPAPVQFDMSSSEAPLQPVKPELVKPKEKTVEEKLEVFEGERVRIVSTIGQRATIAIPFPKQIWARRQFEARFEPEQSELWLSANKGWIEPGAREYPFVLYFEPSEAVTLETTLIVSFGEFETRTPIVASTEGGARRRHRHGE
jgi:hypothetical protein